MKSKRNVTECKDCKKYQDQRCVENRIRQHRKAGREIAKSPHKISGECEGFESKHAEAEEVIPTPVPDPEPTPEPKPFGRFVNWDIPPFDTQGEEDE